VPRLRPGTPLLVRPGNVVHIGIDPADSIVVEVDTPVSAHSVVALLRSLEKPCTPDVLIRRAQAAGLTADDVEIILAGLVAAGRAIPAPTDPIATTLRRDDFRIQIHGQGPLSDLLTASLRGAGLSASRTMHRLPDGSLDALHTQLVVLSDFLVHDPRVVFALTRARIPHLLVRVRDGVGIVGPLVLPGLSSCLMCADHHRSDLDPEWPTLAVQLIRKPGHAEPAVVATTAAIAYGQIERLVTALAGPSGPAAAQLEPPLLNRVVEFRDDPARMDITRWAPHPECDCRPVADSRVRSSNV